MQLSPRGFLPAGQARRARVRQRPRIEVWTEGAAQLTAGGGSKDFFVSYSGADRAWAEWIAWVLEEAGYTVVLQAWDFRPGSNFVLEMQQAAAQAERTIAVFSPDFLASRFTAPEWAAAFARDPTGALGLLLRCGCASANPRAYCRRSSTLTSSDWRTRTPRGIGCSRASSAIGPSPPASRYFLVPRCRPAGARSLRNPASRAPCRGSGTCRVATSTSPEGKSLSTGCTAT
jgi:hypothetical protein